MGLFVHIFGLGWQIIMAAIVWRAQDAVPSAFASLTINWQDREVPVDFDVLALHQGREWCGVSDDGGPDDWGSRFRRM
jgi:hypothetical protein